MRTYIHIKSILFAVCVLSVLTLTTGNLSGQCCSTCGSELCQGCGGKHHGGHGIGCCRHCGRTACLVPCCEISLDTKKVPKNSYHCECADVCLLGCPAPCGCECKEDCFGCKRMVPKWLPQCGITRKKIKLYKHVEDEEVEIAKCEVKYVCSCCGYCCGESEAMDEGSQEPAKKDDGAKSDTKAEEKKGEKAAGEETKNADAPAAVKEADTLEPPKVEGKPMGAEEAPLPGAPSLEAPVDPKSARRGIGNSPTPFDSANKSRSPFQQTKATSGSSGKSKSLVRTLVFDAEK